ncbi:unnamed protein product [Prorocentrum cordatum]|uniref:Prolyl aminopeptidase n=1 Tax=Prorocentrum cordatum TaxID=2364126 RepID=A0ABN9V1J5_9DINO|nr:unnamed protein product [Polarella glacialis]
MSKLHAHFIRAAASKDAWKQAAPPRASGAWRGPTASAAPAPRTTRGASRGCCTRRAGRATHCAWTFAATAGLCVRSAQAALCLGPPARAGEGAEPGAAGACDAELHAWPAAGAALRAAAHAGGARRAVFGGEAAGAFAALQAVVGAPEPAHAAAAGLILMRPPTIWGEREVWRRRYETAAGWVEKDGFEGKDVQWEAKLRLTAASYAGKLSKQEREVILGEWRAMGAPAYAAALRGLAASELPCDSVLRGLQLPVLVLAVPGDAEHPVQAAEDLAAIIPGARLAVAQSFQDAFETWPLLIREMLDSLAAD